MNQTLTRRRFGQLVLATTTVAGLGTLATKLSAQTTTSKLTSVLIGVRLSSQATTNKLNTEAPARLIYSAAQDSGEEGPPAASVPTVTGTTTSTTGVLDVQYLDLSTLQIQKQRIDLLFDGATNTLQPYEQLSSFTCGPRGQLILATNPTKTRKKGNPTRITNVNPSSMPTQTISRLDRDDRVEDLILTDDGSFIGLIAAKKDKKLVRVVQIASNSVSQIKMQLLDDRLFSNLAQSPVTKQLYAITAIPGGYTFLVKIDVNAYTITDWVQLSFNDQWWIVGLKDLAFSPAGQLFALGGRNNKSYDIVNSLFLVNQTTGVMTRLRDFNVHKIAFART